MGGVLLAALAVACALVLALASVANAWADEAAPIADDDVFVALYARDGGGYTLVFQKGEAARAEYGPLEEVYPLDRVIPIGPGDPLGGKRSYVLSAVVADVLQPESTDQWFRGLENLEQVDISKLDTSKVKSAFEMFAGCGSLKSIDLSKFNTASLEEAISMFLNCSSLESLDLSKFDASRVTDMSFMFSGCSSLTSLSFPKNFKTETVEEMRSMFSGCSSLKVLDISNFDISKVTDMGYMFSDCSSLESIVFPAALKTDSVTNMWHMFSGCSSLESLDLSKFDTSKVTIMEAMFKSCSSLKSIQFPATFTTGWVTDMGYMFYDCSSLESLDLSKFDTSRVRDMGSMFSYCYSLDKITLPATGDFAKADLPDWRDSGFVKWRNEKGEVFEADAIPARTAGTYTAVAEDDGSNNDGSGGDNGNGDGNGGNSGSGDGNGNGGNGGNSGSGNGNGGSNNGANNGSGSGSDNSIPKRTVAFSEAVTLPLDATGVAMDKDDIVRDLSKRFGTREGFPANSNGVAVTIKYGGKEVEAIDPTRAGTYEVTAVYSMPDGTERVIEATYTVADPAAKAPVKSTVKSTTRLAQTGDEVSATAPLATAALAACALAAAVAGRRRVRG